MQELSVFELLLLGLGFEGVKFQAARCQGDECRASKAQDMPIHILHTQVVTNQCTIRALVTPVEGPHLAREYPPPATLWTAPDTTPHTLTPLGKGALSPTVAPSGRQEMERRWPGRPYVTAIWSMIPQGACATC